MNKRVLVTYATRGGSTAEVANRIGEILSKQNLTVDVLPVKKVTGIDAYDAVVLGSAIRVSNLLGEAKKFIEENQEAFRQKSLSVFILCMTLSTDNEENRTTVSTYLDSVRAIVKPAKEGLFAGCVDPQRVNLIDRLAIKAVKSPVGDFREWDEIEAWAQELAQEVSAAVPVSA